MAELLASLAFLVGSPPPPNAPIPRDPSSLATTLESTTHSLDSAIDRWHPRSGRVPAGATLYSLYQQRILILLSERPQLSRSVFGRIAHAPTLRAEVLARRELGRLSHPRPRSAFRTGPAAPPDRLRGYYLEGQRRFGIAWNVLAAINYVESAFNKLRNASSAGAQGPMQFIPATWQAYGLGGNVHNPHDAILGAANYLHANGAPRNYRRALYRYNPSWLYVEAVLRYAATIRAEPRAYYVFYSRQVFVRTPHGLVRLTGPR